MTIENHENHVNRHPQTQDQATFGANPREDQVNRRKKAIAALETAQEHIARMGAVYVEFGCVDHSEYCRALYLAIEPIKMALREFAANM